MTEAGPPRHYTASREVVGSGPLRSIGDIRNSSLALAYWRADAVDLVDHTNSEHPTILFHAAGGRVDSEPCNRFRAGGRGWPGESMLVPVGAEVRCRWRQPVEYLHAYFKPGFVEQVALELYGSVVSELQDRSHVRDPSMERLLRQIISVHWDSSDPLLMDDLALRLAKETLNSFSAAAGPIAPSAFALSPARQRRVLEFVEASLGAPLSVADLAGVADMSLSHFAHAFREEFGISPYNYVLSRRVERAKRLLTRSDVPIAVIARTSGFSSQAHLTDIFRRSTGLTPARWRNAA